MAASTEQKVDYLLKKIGYTASKTGLAEDSSLSGTKKAPFAEAVPSPLVIPSTSVWSDSSFIPATPPGATGDYVRVYLSGTSGHRMTVDSTVSGNRSYIAYSTYNDNTTAILGDWIDTQFGASYIIKVYKGDPNSGGVALSAAGSGSSDGWFFDYSSGILNFNDSNVPSGVTDTNIYVVGYRYIGNKGPTAAGGISTFTTQYISGIATFAGDVNLYGNAGVTSAFWDKSGDAVILNDNTKAAFGTGQDLEFSHDGANSTIKNSTGTLFVDNAGTTFRNVTGSETQLAITDNGSVAAYFDNAKKIETLSVGATVTGNLGATSVSISGISTFEGNVDANGTLDVDGQSELDDVNVSGVSTFGQLVSASAGANIAGTAGLNVVGVSTLGQLVTASAGLNVSGAAGLNVAGVTTVAGQIDGNAGADISGGETTLSSATVTDLTSGRLTVAGASGALQDSSNLTFDGTNKLAVTGGLTVSAGATLSSNLDVDGGADISGGGGTTLNVVGHTELDRVNVSAAATFAGDIDANGNIDVDGRADLDDVVVTGVATFSNNIDADGNLDVDGRTDLDDVVVAGVATFSALVDGNAGANFSGAETTLSSATVSDLTDNRIVLAGTSGSLEDSSKITFDGSTLAIVGNATFTGNVSVAGTLTSEDKENIDSVGLITARTGVRITSGGLIVSSGVNTFTDAINANGGLNVNGDLELYGSTGVSSVTWDKSADYLKIKDNAKIVFGNTASSAIWRDGTDTLWANYQGHLTIRGGSSSSNIRIQAKSGDQSINAIKEGAVELYFDGSKKIETAQTGAIVTGVLTATSFSGTLDTAAQPNITSLGTIASLVASRSQVTGVGGFSVTGVSTFTGDIDANGNIDVDGRADLDDVVVTGVATFSNNIDANGDLDVDGHTELDYVNVSAAATFAGFIDANAGANVAGGFVANSAKISDLTSGRVPVVGTDGELEDASTFTFSGGTVTATGFSGNLTGTLQTAAQGNVTSVGTLTGLDVNGHTELDNIQVTGIATVANVVLTKNITGVGATIGGLNVGVVTYYGDGSQLTGIDATSLKDGAGNIKVQAVTTGAIVTGILTATSDIKTTANIYGAQGHFTDHIYIADTIVHTGDTNTKIRFPADDTFSVETAGTERIRINSSGNVIVNNDTVASSNNIFEIHNTIGGRMGFARNDTETLAGNNIGTLNFYGNDSNGTYQEVAAISVNADLDHATGDKPGRIVFSTTPDGAASATEKLRITSAGAIKVTGTRAGALQPEDDDALQLYTASSDNSINRGSGITFYNHDNSGYEMGGTIQVAKENGTADNEAAYMRFSTRPAGAAALERLRIDSAGNMGLAITPDTQGATVDSLQIGSATNLYNESSDDYTILGNNVYFDGSDNKYIKAQESSRLMQNAGEFTFQQAASGSADAAITYTTPLKINASGNTTISNIVLTKNTTGVGATVGGLNVGVVTYFGDGSKLTGTGSDSGGTQRVEVVNTGVILVGVITATDQFSGQITGVGATFTNITGLLATAAQTNITSLGNLTGLTINGDEEFYGSAGVTSAIWDKSENLLNFKDHTKATFGTGNDTTIYHDNSNSYINHTGTGGLNIRMAKDDGVIKVLGNANTDIAHFTDNAGVDLYYNNDKRLQTWSDGVNILGDQDEAAILHLYSDQGDNAADKWRIQALASGSAFSLQNYASGSWETSLYAVGDAQTALYFNDSTKFQTTHHGAIVSGILTATDEVVTSKNLLTLKGTSWADEEKVYTAYTRGAVDLGRIGVEADGAGTAGQIIFEVASSSSPVERMRINSSGKIGIGSADPTSIVDIVAADPVLTIRDTDTGLATANATIRLAESTSGPVLDNYYDIKTGKADTSASNFSFAILSSRSSNVPFYIEPTAGKVGINTTVPTGQLEVKGDLDIKEGKLDVYGSALGGTTADDIDLAVFRCTNGNASLLEIYEERDTDGTDWTTAFTRIQKKIDSTEMGYIQFNGTDNNLGIEIGTNSDEKFIFCNRDQEVSLYYNNSKKIETTNTGVTITGGMSVTGTSPVSFGSTTVSQLVLKDYTETVSVIGDTGTSATLNLANGNVFTATLTGNCTFTFTTSVNAYPNAQSFTLILANDSTPSRTITWPASVKWPNNSVPSRTTTASKTDIWTFMSPDNGTTWYGNIALYNFT